MPFAPTSHLFSVPAQAFTYDPAKNGTHISVSVTYNQVKSQINTMGFACILMTGKEHALSNSHEPDEDKIFSTASLIEQLLFEGHEFYPVGRMHEAILGLEETRAGACSTPAPTAFRCGKECFNQWDCQDTEVTNNNLFVECVRNRCTCKPGFSGSADVGDPCRCSNIDWIMPNEPECLDTEVTAACTPEPTPPPDTPNPAPTDDEEEEDEEEEEPICECDSPFFR